MVLTGSTGVGEDALEGPQSNESQQTECLLTYYGKVQQEVNYNYAATRRDGLRSSMTSSRCTTAFNASARSLHICKDES